MLAQCAMRSPLCALIVLLLGCTTSALNMDHLCALVNDGLMIANNADCGKYYSCSGGKATLNSCADNEYFDKDNQICSPDTEVNCPFAQSSNTSVLSTLCNAKNIGTWLAVPDNCNAYYYCSASGPLLGYCPSGEIFNPIMQMCDYSSQYQCPTSSSSVSSSSSSSNTVEPINLCMFIKQGIYFGTPSLCRGWMKCVNNQVVSGACPIGTNYNVLTSQCNSASDVVCSQVTNDPVLVASEPALPCTNSGDEIESSCSTYFKCNGTFYQLQSCQSGLYYDTISKSCVNRTDARNNCDRCEGSTLSFVNSYSTVNCAGYLVCQNGVTTNSGNCPSQSYFNELEGSCVAGSSEPLFGCCNPAVFANSTSTSGNSTTNSTTVTNSSSGNSNSTTVENPTTNSNSTTVENPTTNSNSTTVENPTTNSTSSVNSPS